MPAYLATMPRAGFKQAVTVFERFDSIQTFNIYAQKPVFSNSIYQPPFTLHNTSFEYFCS